MGVVTRTPDMLATPLPQPEPSVSQSSSKTLLTLTLHTDYQPINDIHLAGEQSNLREDKPKVISESPLRMEVHCTTQINTPSLTNLRVNPEERVKFDENSQADKIHSSEKAKPSSYIEAVLGSLKMAVIYHVRKHCKIFANWFLVKVDKVALVFKPSSATYGDVESHECLERPM